MNFHLALRARVSVILLASALLVAASSSALAQTSTVTWDRNSDAFTAGYLLSYGTQSGSYSATVDVGNVVSYPVSMAPGNTYYVMVRAYNSLRQYGPASSEASVVIPALPTPPTATITATLGAIGTASVTWRTTNATAVTVNGAGVALNATANYPIAQTTTYTVVATGAGGTATASATVVVPRVDCQMSGWTFTSATAWSACTSGQRTRNETWNRTITTQPSGGGAACGVTQEVRVVSEPCTVATTPTAQLTATAGSTAGTAKVTWQSTNATAATLNGVAVATSGTAQYNITATTTYTLVVTGPGGTASAFGTVVVAAPVDCVLSTWSLQSASPWGACTGGQQTRTETWARSIITPPSNGGAACGILQEQRTAAQACTDPTPTAPGSPTSFKATTSGNNVTLGWNVPAAGGAANGYRIWVGATTSWELVNGMDVGNALSASGTLGAGTYYARVAAFNTVGTSAPTEISFRVGAKKKPSRPVGFDRVAAGLGGSALVVGACRRRPRLAHRIRH